jgi:hypothetical protein
MPLWEIEYEREVANYFFDNAPYTNLLFDKIEELSDTPEGLPAEGYVSFAGEFNHYWWFILDHDVLFEIIKAGTPTIRIWVVKPL